MNPVQAGHLVFRKECCTGQRSIGTRAISTEKIVVSQEIRKK
ncbi:hypothetical protein [Algoriphagus ratkowskyi]|nr:hypothetical protein [Algoriphagus ratkowskyi]